MKTFKDLRFQSHPVAEGLMARLNFSNGYGVSVVRFRMPTMPFAFTLSALSSLSQGESIVKYGSFTSNEDEWELAILKNNDLCYDSGITDNVMGHLSEKDVTRIMKRVQGLKSKRKIKIQKKTPATGGNKK